MSSTTYDPDIHVWANKVSVALLAEITLTRAEAWLEKHTFKLILINIKNYAILKSDVIYHAKLYRELAPDIPEILREISPWVLPAFGESFEHGAELRAWCKYCRIWHYHGVGDGVRASHCISPNIRYSNYELIYVGEFTSDVKKVAPTRKYPLELGIT